MCTFLSLRCKPTLPSCFTGWVFPSFGWSWSWLGPCQQFHSAARTPEGLPIWPATPEGIGPPRPSAAALLHQLQLRDFIPLRPSCCSASLLHFVPHHYACPGTWTLLGVRERTGTDQTCFLPAFSLTGPGLPPSSLLQSLVETIWVTEEGCMR